MKDFSQKKSIIIHQIDLNQKKWIAFNQENPNEKYEIELNKMDLKNGIKFASTLCHKKDFVQLKFFNVFSSFHVFDVSYFSYFFPFRDDLDVFDVDSASFDDDEGFSVQDDKNDLETIDPLTDNQKDKRNFCILN